MRTELRSQGSERARQRRIQVRNDRKRRLRLGVLAAVVVGGLIAWSIWYPIKTRSSYVAKTKTTLMTKFNLWGVPLWSSMGSDQGFFATGPTASSGQPHGEWIATLNSGSASPIFSSVWYWYGEAVTEGEWKKNAH